MKIYNQKFIYFICIVFSAWCTFLFGSHLLFPLNFYFKLADICFVYIQISILRNEIFSAR